MIKAVFIDKDGTLVHNVPYNADASKITLMPGAVECLRLLHAVGYTLVIASNQSGIAHGYFTEDEFNNMMEQLLDMIPVPIEGYVYCPHHPDGCMETYTIDCSCRKPGPGLLMQASEELGIDLHASWMIGDILHDVEAGNRAGCRTVLVDSGGETEWHVTPIRKPDFIAADLMEAAAFIINSKA